MGQTDNEKNQAKATMMFKLSALYTVHSRHLNLRCLQQVKPSTQSALDTAMTQLSTLFRLM